MIPSALSWSPNGESILYSRVHGDLRKIYHYDCIQQISVPLNLPTSLWFEFQFIHNEQCFYHHWKKGIYLYDLKNKKSQKCVSTDDCRFMYFDTDSRKLLYNHQDNVYIFDPHHMKSMLLAEHTAELLIDAKRKSFIRVSSDHMADLDIFYKNESIFQMKNHYNIFLSNDLEQLLSFSDLEDKHTVELSCLNLHQFKQRMHIAFKGILQSSNQTENRIHFSIFNNGKYEFFILDFKKETVRSLYEFDSLNPCYSALSPNEEQIAILVDFENDSELKLIDI